MLFRLKIFILCLVVGLTTKSFAVTADYTNVIPLPASIVLADEPGFVVSRNTSFESDKANKKNLQFLKNYLVYANEEGFRNKISLCINPKVSNPEGYRIFISEKVCKIEGKTAAGVFYAIQTLRKSFDPFARGNVTFPSGVIADEPRFGYRGAMLDVARHFFTKDEVKRYIDQLAMHNINKFHWHLSDDQGWRIEIKSRPELIRKSTMRPQTVVGHNLPRFDGTPHGGYYTQAEIKEILEFAADRNITIIPEIDIPGHAMGSLAAYPELGCTGGPYELWQMWGVSEEVLCAGNPETYKYLEDVLGEVADLFPGKEIHVGGDECPKRRWRECGKCQAKIAELGIKPEENRTCEQQLQSHIMEYAQNFLSKKGKRIIGWDEILEGGIGNDAIIMSWQGEEGGIAAARQGLDVIMAPNSHLYFDYFQTHDIEHEPLGFTDYLPLEKVYGYDPMPKELSEEERKHILGVQGCLWTAFIPDSNLLEYMSYPRMAALAEMQWCAPGKRDYKRFCASLPEFLKHYKALGCNFSTRAFDVTGDFKYTDNGMQVALKTVNEAPVFYSLDGSEPNVESPLYTSPIFISKSATLKAVAKHKGFGVSNVYNEYLDLHKGVGKPLTILTECLPEYTKLPSSTLNDGLHGTANKKTGRWIGFKDNDAEVVLDLQDNTPVSNVRVANVMMKYKWILPAKKIKVEVSENNVDFQTVAYQTYPSFNWDMPDMVYERKVTFPEVSCRFIRITVEREKEHPICTSNGPSFLFLDEISIN